MCRILYYYINWDGNVCLQCSIIPWDEDSELYESEKKKLSTCKLGLFYCLLILTRNDVKCCFRFFFVMIDSKLELNWPYQGTLSRQQELKVKRKYQSITKKLMICDPHFWEELRRSDTCIWSLQMFPHTSLTFLEGPAVIMIPCRTCSKAKNA